MLPLINSIMVRPERMEGLLPLAKEYDCDFVALLVPRGCQKRTRALCSELVYKAESEFGIAADRMYVGPR